MVKVLAALSLAYFLIDVYGLGYKLKKWFKIKGRVKPFDCNYCLTFWVCVVLYFVPEYYSNFIALTFGAAYLSKFIK
jgi:hypothetical protein